MINTIEACERIKEEYNFLQAQNQNLKLECEKIAQEKTEMQRHYYYEMSYGLNVEMHKQTEIAKRLSAICAQLVPYLSQEVIILGFVYKPVNFLVNIKYFGVVFSINSKYQLQLNEQNK